MSDLTAASTFAPQPTVIGSVGLHRFTVVTAVATGLLIVVGGLVTSHEAGLAVPDWPTTYGQNMFAYPLSQWVGGILYEHGHRLVASGVGMLTVVLALWIWKVERRFGMHVLGAVAIFGVVLQGVLGGLRVVWLSDALAISHACLAQAFFALIVAMAVFSSAGWQKVEPRPETTAGTSLRWIAILVTASIYFQLILGAILRHSGTITGVPLIAHLAGALAVLLGVGWLGLRVFGPHAKDGYLTVPAGAVVLLFIVQLGLGFGSLVVRMMAESIHWPTRLEIVFTTAHVGTGALLLAAGVIMTLRAFRRLTPAPAGSGPAPAEQRVS